jgi:hypothetical protein
MISRAGGTLMANRDFWEAFPMTAPDDGTAPANGEHYREMARGLRELARRCRLAGARKELLHLAANYDRRADVFDSRAC